MELRCEMILILLGGRVSSYCHLWLAGGYEQTFHLVIDEGIRNSITFLWYFLEIVIKSLMLQRKRDVQLGRRANLMLLGRRLIYEEFKTWVIGWVSSLSKGGVQGNRMIWERLNRFLASYQVGTLFRTIGCIITKYTNLIIAWFCWKLKSWMEGDGEGGEGVFTLRYSGSQTWIFGIW